MTLYAANVQRARVELREEGGIYCLWAYERGNGKTVFRDRTDRYRWALLWLCRFLGDHGFPTYRAARPEFAARMLNLPPVPSALPEAKEVLHVLV